MNGFSDRSATLNTASRLKWSVAWKSPAMSPFTVSTWSTSHNVCVIALSPNFLLISAQAPQSYAPPPFPSAPPPHQPHYPPLNPEPDFSRPYHNAGGPSQNAPAPNCHHCNSYGCHHCRHWCDTKWPCFSKEKLKKNILSIFNTEICSGMKWIKIEEILEDSW